MQKLKIISILLLISGTMQTQFKITSPVKWSYAATKAKNTEAVIYLKATVEDGWHIYAQNGGVKALQTNFTFSKAIL